MSLYHKVCLLIALPSILSPTLAALEIKVQVKPDVIEQYSPIEYKITIIGTDEIPVVDALFPESLYAMSQRDYYASRQSSPRGDDSWVQITWKGYPTQSGPLEIPVQNLQFESGVYQSEAAAFYVQPAAPTLDELIDFEFSFPKTDAYLGESLKGNLQLKIRRDLRVLISQPPQIQSAGVTSRLERNLQTVRTHKGLDLDRIYQWPLELTPYRIGQNPQEAYLIIRWQKPTASNTGYANNTFYERLVPAQTLVLQAAALPTKPPQFKGLIGDWSLNSKLPERKLTIRDALVWELHIQGEGSIPPLHDAITLSDIDAWRVEGPVIKSTDSATTLQYLLFPNKAGALYTPKAELVNFDPNSGQYETLQTGGDVIFVTN